jgi:hypothetical protein
MSQDERYRQLALFSVILAEVVMIPAVLGGLVWFAARNLAARGLLSTVAAVFGLGIAFYRISRMMKKQQANDPERK